ncbi:MAG: hypothetical protein HC802_03325 [Caldilineaceae bacterium]|nr:hypothetical protein [Caldilineaceae bacterium]
MNRSRLVVHLILVTICLVVATLIARYLLTPRGPFHWDEAAHALKGLLIAHDIRSGDWISFLYDTYRQVLWPPLHSWLTAIAFLIAGPGYATAGAVSLFTFIATAPLLYLAGDRMAEQQVNRIGLIAAILFLTSPALVPFSVQSMLEIPGLFALVATIWVYFWLIDSRAEAKQFAWLGLAVALTFLIRTHYGVLIFIAIFISMLFDARFRPRTVLDRRFFFMLAPMVLIFAIWFAYPPKLTATLGWLINYPAGVDDPYSTAGWLFYPQGWFRIAGSTVIGIFYLAFFLVAFKWRTSSVVRLLLILVTVQIVIGMFHHNKQDRYIFPILPPLFLITAFVLDKAWRLSTQSGEVIRYWLPRVGTVALLAYSTVLFVGALRPQAPQFNSELAQHIANEARRNGATLIVGSMDLARPNPPLLDWQLIVEEGVMAAPQAGSAVQIDEERSLLAMLESPRIPDGIRNMLSPTLQRSEQIGVVRSIYLGLPLRASYSQGAQQFDHFFQRTLKEYPFDDRAGHHLPCPSTLAIRWTILHPV